MKISKSKFVAGCQCLKRLWFQVHQPELAAQPDAAAETIMEQGHEVGLLARQLFRGGVEVDGSGGLEQAIRTTQELIANPEVPAIYEGAFERNGVFVRVGTSSTGLTARHGARRDELGSRHSLRTCPSHDLLSLHFVLRPQRIEIKSERYVKA